MRPEAVWGSPKRFAAGQLEHLLCAEQSLFASVFPAFKRYIARCNQSSENKAIKEIAGDSQTATDTNQLQEGLSTQPAQYLIFWSGLGGYF